MLAFINYKIYMDLVVHQKHVFYNSYMCNAHYNNFRSKCMWRKKKKKPTNSPMIALGSSGLPSTSTNNNSAATIAPPATNMPQPNAKFNKPNTTTMTTTTPGEAIQTGKQKLEVQKKDKGKFSIPNSTLSI